MDTLEVMRTTFAARDYTDRPLDDATLHRILDHARFAPSGGNRQGWHVIVLKDRQVRKQLANLMAPTIKQYKAQAVKGGNHPATSPPSAILVGITLGKSLLYPVPNALV